MSIILAGHETGNYSLYDKLSAMDGMNATNSDCNESLIFREGIGTLAVGQP
jgi:hypothetical protein